MVYVQFCYTDEKPLTWKLDGAPGPGVYPIKPLRRAWYLDKCRSVPQLKIQRRQLPLMPAFATTAHAAQGLTFSRGAIIDLTLGRNANTRLSYVALTRVERQEDLLISRAFPKEFFDNSQ